MPSAGVHVSVACLKSCMYYDYHWTFTTMKMMMVTQARQLQLCSLPLERPQGRHFLLNYCWLRFIFRWTRRRCCRENFWSHALCLLCWPQAKQAHVFHSTAILLLHSCGAQCSESTESDCCLTSRRLHHCWASCLEMLMVLCGFFRTLGQHFPHQMSFLCCPIPACASFSVQSIIHEWQAWGSQRYLKEIRM